MLLGRHCHLVPSSCSAVEHPVKINFYGIEENRLKMFDKKAVPLKKGAAKKSKMKKVLQYKSSKKSPKILTKLF